MLECKKEDVIILVGAAGVLRRYHGISGALAVARVAHAITIAICLVRIEDAWAVIVNVGDLILI